MQIEKLRTIEHKLTCQECENVIEVPDDLEVGDFFECNYCGIEYEVLAVTDDGEYEVMIVEEEK
jgi:uncharacterized paraquat-inducible protein A